MDLDKIIIFGIAFLVFILGILFSLPNEMNIGVVLIQILGDLFCNGSIQGSELACNMVPQLMNTLKFIARLILILDIACLIYLGKEAING